ncbi:unnamed protein product [Lampetra planeri]
MGPRVPPATTRGAPRPIARGHGESDFKSVVRESENLACKSSQRCLAYGCRTEMKAAAPDAHLSPPPRPPGNDNEELLGAGGPPPLPPLVCPFPAGTPRALNELEALTVALVP